MCIRDRLEKGQIRREKLFGERFSRFLKTIDAAGDGAEMNRFYLEQLSTHPVSYTHLDVYKRQGQYGPRHPDWSVPVRKRTWS